MKLLTGLGWDKNLIFELRGDRKSQMKISSGDEISLNISETRRCVGYRPPKGKSLIPCPESYEGNASQCEKCLERSRTLPCLRCTGEYCRNPTRRNECVSPFNHALYIASFGVGVHKVGVAKWDRRYQRLAEQGARRALIVARDDGQKIRRSEALMKKLGVPDRLSPHEKLEAAQMECSTETLDDELETLLESLKRRMRAQWVSPQKMDLPDIPAIPHARLLNPSGLQINGVVTTTVGQILVIEDEGQIVAVDGASLVGREIRTDVVTSNYQMELV